MRASFDALAADALDEVVVILVAYSTENSEEPVTAVSEQWSGGCPAEVAAALCPEASRRSFTTDFADDTDGRAASGNQDLGGRYDMPQDLMD